MRAPSLALLLIGILSVPSFAVDIVELKSGRVLEAEEVTFKGDKLHIKLYRPQGDQTIAVPGKAPGQRQVVGGMVAAEYRIGRRAPGDHCRTAPPRRRL